MNVVTSWKILRWPKFRIVSLKDDLWRWEKPSTINVKLNKSSFCPRCFPHKIQGQNAKPYLKAILCLKPLKQCLLYYSVFYRVRIWILYYKTQNLKLPWFKIREYKEFMQLQLAAASNFEQWMECATFLCVSKSVHVIALSPPAKFHYCKNKM